MRKQKQTQRLLGCMVLLAILLGCLGGVGARTLVDTEREASLSLAYRFEEHSFSDLTIEIYRVADFSTEGLFELSERFAEYPISLSEVKTQGEWNEIASTLDAYVIADAKEPDSIAVTDNRGIASFSALVPGLYLVKGCRAEYEEGYCEYQTFLISAPGLDEADNWTYEVEALPKIQHHEITGREMELTVTKLWSDSGYEEKRPTSVEVALFKDGVPVETVMLGAENNWNYRWSVRDDGAVWSVAERNVAEEYTVRVEKNGTAFLITNAHENRIPEPPQTGDSLSLYLIAAAVGAVGVILLLVGITKRGGNRS